MSLSCRTDSDGLERPACIYIYTYIYKTCFASHSWEGLSWHAASGCINGLQIASAFRNKFVNKFWKNGVLRPQDNLCHPRKSCHKSNAVTTLILQKVYSYPWGMSLYHIIICHLLPPNARSKKLILAKHMAVHYLSLIVKVLGQFRKKVCQDTNQKQLSHIWVFLFRVWVLFSFNMLINLLTTIRPS